MASISLRDSLKGGRLYAALALAALVGGGAAVLVALGNPGNMGICGACFLRDIGGSLGLAGKGPAYFRPEVVGLVLGAMLLALAQGRFEARSGSHAVSRFVLGMWTGIGALAFLGCPFRMMQRLGGGDLTAWAALPGFILGVGAAVLLEQRGYSAGKTAKSAAPVGWIGPAILLLGLYLFLKGGVLLGPGAGDEAKPPHAMWIWALVIGAGAGAILSALGFCAISAARQCFLPGKTMLLAALALVAGFAAVSAATGRFHLGLSGQPAAHGDILWNVLALALVGLTGALSGGCPVRQIVMTGEGNGDAFVTVVGILLGGSLAHTLGLAGVPATAESAGGIPAAGQAAIVIGLVFSLAYGIVVARYNRRAAA